MITLRFFFLKENGALPNLGGLEKGNERVTKSLPEKVEADDILTGRGNGIEIKPEGGLSPAVARSLLEESRKIADVFERAAKCGDIIGALCLAGFQEEAWSLISEGQGVVRNKELEYYFLNAQLSPDEFSEKYKDLRISAESGISLSSWLRHFDLVKAKSLLDSLAVDGPLARSRALDPNLFDGGVSLYFQIQLRTSSGDELGAVLLAASSLLNSGVLNPSDAPYIIDSTKFEDPFQKWEYIESILNPKTNQFLTRTKSKAISEMVTSDSSAAIVLFKDAENPGNFYQAISTWIDLDSTQSVDWYTNNRKSLKIPMQSAAASAFFKKALISGELDSAENWAQEIQDPKQKKAALKLVSDKVEKSSQ